MENSLKQIGEILDDLDAAPTQKKKKAQKKPKQPRALPHGHDMTEEDVLAEILASREVPVASEDAATQPKEAPLSLPELRGEGRRLVAAVGNTRLTEVFEDVLRLAGKKAII
jgi:hypothetical protein